MHRFHPLQKTAVRLRSADIAVDISTSLLRPKMEYEELRGINGAQLYHTKAQCWTESAAYCAKLQNIELIKGTILHL